jgi:hypothetical protein
VFDYADVYDARTILLRIGEVAFFAVLNDAGQVGRTFPRAHALAKNVRKSNAALTPLQIRELYAEPVTPPRPGRGRGAMLASDRYCGVASRLGKATGRTKAASTC